MPTPSRTIRLFVSSTFSDMKAERDLLQREIFPRLRQQCLAKGFRFQPIDLRWGVSDEAGRDNRTMRICLRELRRCQSDGPKPNFLILLGDRYGWRPLPETIPAELFEKLEPCLTAENAKSAEQSQEGRTTADHAPAFAEPSAGRDGRGSPKSLSVNVGEVRGENSGAVALLRICYRRDDNAVPPVYVLQPRQAPFADPTVWSEQVEAPLLTALQRAARAAGLDVGAASRCDDSGDRGINPLLQPDSSRRTLACQFAALHLGLSATHQEILHGALNLPADEVRQHVHAFSRTIQLPAGKLPHPDFTDRRSDGTPDPAAREQLDGLRSALAAHITPDNVHGYSVDWRDDSKFTDADLSRFRDNVFKSLESVIAEQVKAMESVPVAEQEENSHRAFGAERRAGFVGRETELARVTDYLAGTDARPLLVLGPAGSGKSAFMAQAAQCSGFPVPGSALAEIPTQNSEPKTQNSESGTQNPEPGTRNQFVAIERYIGTTPAASRVVSVLHDLVQRLRAAIPIAAAAEGGATPSERAEPSGEEGKPKSDDEIPSEFNPLVTAFHEALKRVTPEKPLILFLDGLDQFSGTDLDSIAAWIPTTLPAGVRLVVSAALPQSVDSSRSPVGRGLSPTIRPESGMKSDLQLQVAPAEKSPQARVHAILTSRLPADTHLILPPLQHDHGGQMLDRWLAAAGRTLQPEQRAAVLGTFAIEGNPLWLRTAAEEASRLTSWAPAPALPSTTTDLIRRLLERLSTENEHGAVLVERALGYLACSRQGLSEDEILDLLSGNDAVMADFRRRFPKSPEVTALPVATWVPFFGDVSPFLGEHEAHGASLLRFYHRVLLETVESSFLAATETRLRNHSAMAEYFTQQARGTVAARLWETSPTRGFAECVYHQANAQSWYEVEHTLSDFGFLMQKVRHGLLEGLLDDWSVLDAQAPADTRKRLDISRAFFREKAHILRRGNHEWPAYKILLQLAVEHADDSPLTLGAERWLTEGHCDWIWLRNNQRLPHAQKNPCLAVFEDHAEGVNGALALADGRILSWSSDKTLRLWDNPSGKCLTVLEGHLGGVNGALVMADGRILSWSSDNTLRLWDNLSGKCLAALEGHSGWIYGALVVPDGRILSWSSDKILRLWDNQTAKCLTVLEGHVREVNGALVLPDSRILSWSHDKTLRIWDSRSGECVTVLEGHLQSIGGALVLPDSRILSWTGYSQSAEESALRIWDSQTGKCLAVLVGHVREVNGALVLPDSRILSWSHDKTLRIWDSRSGECVTALEGHLQSVGGALVLPNGRILSWTGYSWFEEESALRIWDSQTGKCLAVLKGHSEWINDAMVPPDGRILSWSYDKTLRLWESQSGKCLAVLAGHTDWVSGAQALASDRILSWSEKDNTLRLWDISHPGTHFAVLERHSERVNGVAALDDGRYLSWSLDKSLRLWDGKSGKCLVVLEGHSAWVSHALALADGRILSWSGDKTLRLWDSQSGECLAILEGHSDVVMGAAALADGEILSWTGVEDSVSADHSVRLWDSQSGKCLAVFDTRSFESPYPQALPDGRLVGLRGDDVLLWDKPSRKRFWLCGTRIYKPPTVLKAPSRIAVEGVLGDWISSFAGFSARLSQKAIPSVYASWHAESISGSKIPYLRSDGTAVLTREYGQVCFLQFHHGNRPISIAELERMELGVLSPAS